MLLSEKSAWSMLLALNIVKIAFMTKDCFNFNGELGPIFIQVIYANSYNNAQDCGHHREALSYG